MWEHNRILERRRQDVESDHQRRIRLQTLNAHRVPTQLPETPDEVVDKNKVLQIASKLEAFLNNEMFGCRGVLTRNTIMEEFLGLEFVLPHLPSYYLALVDARVQQYVVEGFQGRLEAVKGVHSREMLAYRSALLDAAVSKGGCMGMGGAMARILNVRPKNIIQASERRARLAQSGESEFVLQVTKKRNDVLDSGTVAMVEL
jgi:hypothetical protein